MRTIFKVTLSVAILAGYLSFLVGQQPTAATGRGGAAVRQLPTVAWAPKPIKPNGWIAPNKPITKLSDLLTKHKGQTDWTETIVSDDYLHGDYISMGPGKKTQPRFNPDTREWWVIQDGQIRFTIEGQEPFVATKGYLVQVPYRNTYSMETVGDKPSLRFEVNIANVKKMYPVSEKPPVVPGMEFVKVTIAGKGTYAGGNRPFIDFNEVAAGRDPQRRFIADDRAVSNIIMGQGGPDPNPASKGHFHEECAEFWFILQGQMRYTIETLPTFIADQGDIVYAPKQMWHSPSFAGTGPATRLAMNGYQDIGHSFEAPLE
jgi:mannose-6-phosphate isomerase-like protein (cupin superfamily)